jgi:acetyl esterase/lipase
MHYIKILPVPVSLLFSVCCMVTGCSQKVDRSASAEEVSDCFVNPSPAKYAACFPKTSDTARLKTAFGAIRSRADTGTVRVWLTDSAGLRYCLGYATPHDRAHDTAGTAYPLIIYLHGGIGTERNDKGDSAFLMLTALADTFKLFLASPSANRFAPWWSPIGLSRILQTLRFMTLRYPVDPRKVFLAGVSDGATGCYAAANTICAPFAGFIAVSGFGGMLPMLGMQLAPGNLMQRPIYNVNAGLDHIYPVENVKEFVRLLQEQGVGIISKIYPDEKHGFDYRGKEMGTLANLIRTWSLPSASGLSWTFIKGFPNLPPHCCDWTLAADDASVNAFWRHDTLIIRAEGLQTLTASFPDIPSGEKIACRILSGDEKPRVRIFAPIKIRGPQRLQFMVKRCFPWFGKEYIYTIKF